MPLATVLPLEMVSVPVPILFTGWLPTICPANSSSPAMLAPVVLNSTALPARVVVPATRRWVLLVPVTLSTWLPMVRLLTMMLSPLPAVAL